MTGLSLTARELAERLGCTLEGDGSRVIRDVSTIEDAGPEHVTFLSNTRYRKSLAQSRAGAIVVAATEPTPPEMVRLVSRQPYQDYRRAQELFHPPAEPEVAKGIHPQAVVDPSAKLGADVRVGPFVQVQAGAVIGDRSILSKGAYVGRDVVLGEDCVLFVNAVVNHGCRLGNRVVIGDNTVIGFDGFGYAPDQQGVYHKIPQVGVVEIADDVEIGANTCVDRAAMGATRIGRGTKIDNLVQVAHGVQIGEHTVLAGLSAIAGSARVGSHVMIGGQAAVAGHISVGDRVVVGGQAGVTKSFDTPGILSGSPARPLTEVRRMEASLTRLPELLKRVKALEKQVVALGGKLESADGDKPAAD